jgi:hypothetical protein
MGTMRGKAQKVKQADLTRLGAGPPSEAGGPHLPLFPKIHFRSQLRRSADAVMNAT